MKLFLCQVSLLAVCLFGLVVSETQIPCPGALEAQYQSGPSDCGQPAWNFWYFDHQILLPSKDPTRFYQTTTNSVVEMRCAPGTCFSQVDQFCVHSWQWQNPCRTSVDE